MQQQINQTSPEMAKHTAEVSTHKEIDLGKVVQVLKDNKKQIIRNTIFATIIAALYAFTATPIFTAKELINPPKLSDAGIGLSQALGGLAALTGGGGGFMMQRTDADVAIAMLKTNAVSDSLIKQFNLQKYYKQKDIELTRKHLSGKVKFVPDMKSGFLEIAVEDKDPKLAAKLANYYTVALGQLISDVAYGKSRRQLQFYTKQVASSKQRLIQAQAALKAFAKQNGIIAGQQAQMITGLSTQLQAQLVVARSQLQAMSLYATDDNPDYKSVLAHADSLKQQLADLSGQNEINDKLIIPANLAPELAQQYADLMRNFLLNEQVYNLMLRQYEGARIDTLSEVAPVALQVLDMADVPIHKSKPKRALIIVFSCLISMLTTGIYMIIKNRKQIIGDAKF